MSASIIHFQYWTARICKLQVPCKEETHNCCYVHAVSQSRQFKFAQFDCGMYLIKDAITLLSKKYISYSPTKHSVNWSDKFGNNGNILHKVCFYVSNRRTSLEMENTDDTDAHPQMTSSTDTQVHVCPCLHVLWTVCPISGCACSPVFLASVFVLYHSLF